MNLTKLQRTTVKTTLKQRVSILKKIDNLVAKRDEIINQYQAEIDIHVEILKSLDNTILKTVGFMDSVDEVIDFLENENKNTPEVAILGQEVPTINEETVDIPTQEEEILPLKNEENSSITNETVPVEDILNEDENESSENIETEPDTTIEEVPAF